jgi:hypothetical protein
MKRIIFLPALLITMLICETSFSAEVLRTFNSKDGKITIEKSGKNYLVKGFEKIAGTYINGNGTINITKKQGNNYIYTIKGQSKKQRDCKFDTSANLRVDATYKKPGLILDLDDIVGTIELVNNDEITLKVGIKFETECLRQLSADNYKKK